MSNENEKMNIEKRDTFGLLEYRIDEGKEKKYLRGYAARFNQVADLYWFDEEVLPGAFRNAIQKDDVRALIDHNSSLVLGRNIAKTLELFEDNLGLGVKIDPPETHAAQDIIKSVERGDVSGMSFSFRTNVVKWINGKSRGEGKNDLRQLVDVSLRDVSIVTYPAYALTDIKYRSENRSIEDIYNNRYNHIGHNLQFYKRYFLQLV
jgi:HK97 family phage prohead protease